MESKVPDLPGPPFFSALTWGWDPGTPTSGGQRPAGLQRRGRSLEDVTPAAVPPPPVSPPLPLSKLARNGLLRRASPARAPLPSGRAGERRAAGALPQSHCRCEGDDGGPGKSQSGETSGPARSGCTFESARSPGCAFSRGNAGVCPELITLR